MRHFVGIFIILIGAPVTVVDAWGQKGLRVKNREGVQLLVSEDYTQPVVRIVLPDPSVSDRAIEVIFPEHVTGRPKGSTSARQLYMFRPGNSGTRPTWKQTGQTLEYEVNFPEGVNMVARAILEDDGVRFRYDLTNNSKTDFDMIYAVTDPRLTSIFKDERMERTYIHHKEGFELLASELPDRLTIPIDQWLPCRCLASFTWPIPTKRKVVDSESIAYYYKSRAVDKPFVVTKSSENEWLVASFSREPGNVWSNPELTCQHVDPQVSLAPGKNAVLEVKLLIIKGTLDDALRKAEKQIPFLK